MPRICRERNLELNSGAARAGGWQGGGVRTAGVEGPRSQMVMTLERYRSKII